MTTINPHAILRIQTSLPCGRLGGVTTRSWVVVVVLAAACGGSKSGSDAPPPPKKPVAKDVPKGLDLRLSNGKTGKPAADHASLAPATKLDAPAVAQLLSRAKPLAPEPADLQAFAIRPGSQPPPRTGTVVTPPFPPPVQAGPPPTATGTGKGLSVVRWMP